MPMSPLQTAAAAARRIALRRDPPSVDHGGSRFNDSGRPPPVSVLPHQFLGVHAREQLPAGGGIE